jgi:hypothetical protein
MASHQISGQVWPDATVVGVYPASAFPSSASAPAGSTVASGTVSGGSVTFTGLAERVPYVAYAGGVSRRFLIGQQDPTDARSLRARVDELAGDTVPAILPAVVNAGSLGASYTLALEGRARVIMRGTLTADCTITVSGLSAGAEFVLELTQDATGGRTVVLPVASEPAGALGVDGTAGVVTVLQYYSPDGAGLVGFGTTPVADRRRPDQNGLKAWTLPPDEVHGGVTWFEPTAGVLYVIEADVPEALSAALTKVWWHQPAAPSATDMANVFLGVYSKAGVLLGKTANQATVVQTSGVHSATLTAEVGKALTSPAGRNEKFRLGLLVGTQNTGAIKVRVPVAGDGSFGLVNIGIAAAPYRAGTVGTGLSALPASFDPTTMGTGPLLFLAVS